MTVSSLCCCSLTRTPCSKLLSTTLHSTPLLTLFAFAALAGCGFPTHIHTHKHTLALSLARRRCIIAWRADCCAATAGVAAAVARVLVLVLLFVVSLTCSQLLLQLLLLCCCCSCCCCWQCKTLHCNKIELPSPSSSLNWHNDLIKNKHLHCIATMRRRLGRP